MYIHYDSHSQHTIQWNNDCDTMRHFKGRQRDAELEHIQYRWQARLESLMKHFGASAYVDLPEMDPSSCEGSGQYRRAVRARARYLTRQIAWILFTASANTADELFRDLIVRAQLISDGPTWFVIEQRTSPLNASSRK